MRLTQLAENRPLVRLNALLHDQRGAGLCNTGAPKRAMRQKRINEGFLQRTALSFGQISLTGPAVYAADNAEAAALLKGHLEAFRRRC